ncbi:MAG: FlgD immunoglobulin-like domain containing protein [bacterium]
MLFKRKAQVSVLFGVFFSLVPFLFSKGLLAQTDFTQVTDQPVLSYGAAGEWDDGTVWYPAVIKDGDTLRMWYTGHDRSMTPPFPNGKIGYAWSLDGIEWHRFAGNPVLSDELPWEEGQIFACAVIKDGDTFKMWYGAVPTPSRKIGYATSTDGINWSKHPDPVLQVGPFFDWDYSIIGPHTVIKEDSVYNMWYWGATGGFPFESSIIQIGLATSTDGINWVKYDDPSTTETPFSSSDPVLKVGAPGEWDANRAGSPMVLPTEAGYEMWYIGLKPPITSTTDDLVGYATSSDGISWTKWPTNPILTTYPSWGFAYQGGTVLKFDGKYHLWYACFHPNFRPQIGYATSPITTDVESPENEHVIPAQFRLLQNYPNPFNPETRISYEVAKPARVVLQVMNLLGQEVRTLVDEEKPAGFYEVMWDGRDNHGQRVASGVYLYRLETRGFVQTRKMVLLQ